MGAKFTPPKANRVPFIPMLKENKVRKGFFERWEFVAVRDALPEYLKGYVTFKRPDQLRALAEVHGNRTHLPGF